MFQDDVIINYFFNARGVALQKSTQGMYRSLLHQIIEKVPGVSSTLPLRKCTRLRDQDWPVEYLTELFRCAVLAFDSTRLTCYIDALDESGKYMFDTICLLLNEGADVDALDHSAATALMHLCKVWDE